MSLRTLKLALVVAIALPVTGVFAGSAEKENKVIDKFLKSVESNDQLDDEKRQQIAKMVNELRDDEYNRPLAIMEGLREVYAEFRSALEAMGGEDLNPAINALNKLTKSEDPFLATESSFYLAQAYSFVERYEDAIPILKKIIDAEEANTVQTGDATFLLGVSQSRTLNRKDAIATLTRFIDENPNAPERLRIGAWRQREQLKMLEEGTMADVYDRMDFSRRRLMQEASGKQTQEQQDKIIAMLAKLIKQAEEKECNCSGSGSGEGQKDGKEGEGEGQGKSGKGGGSKNQDGKVVRTYNRGPQSPWSKLRDRQRDPAYSAIKEKFPARYQKLVEQYYESFQNDGGE